MQAKLTLRDPSELRFKTGGYPKYRCPCSGCGRVNDSARRIIAHLIADHAAEMPAEWPGRIRGVSASGATGLEHLKRVHGLMAGWGDLSYFLLQARTTNNHANACPHFDLLLTCSMLAGEPEAAPEQARGDAEMQAKVRAVGASGEPDAAPVLPPAEEELAETLRRALHVAEEAEVAGGTGVAAVQAAPGAGPAPPSPERPLFLVTAEQRRLYANRLVAFCLDPGISDAHALIIRMSTEALGGCFPGWSQQCADPSSDSSQEYKTH